MGDDLDPLQQRLARAHVEEQGKLTDELRARIEAAATLQAVEDLYLPYKPKRRTRATIARERGLEPLAETMLAQELTQGDLDEIAAQDRSRAAEAAAARGDQIIAVLNVDSLDGKSDEDMAAGKMTSARSSRSPSSLQRCW